MNNAKTRVLIVDDEESVARMLALTLRQTGGYETMEETRADQVVLTARQFRPDVVILDVVMPEMDGGDVLALLHADPITRDIPVIFITALVGSEESPLGGLISAGHRFLPKPVSCAELSRCIDEVVAEARARERGADPSFTSWASAAFDSSAGPMPPASPGG